MMDATIMTWVVIGIVAVLVLLVGGVGAMRAGTRRRQRHAHTTQLREHFGPEYDTVVQERGRKDGEADLRHRLAAHEDLDLQRPPPDVRDEATTQWKEIQYRFLEDPGYSVREAEHLVVTVMRERGYPVDDLESRLRVLSVDWPEVASEYRNAYETYRASEDAEAGLTDRFEAMLRYRLVFETLLERPQRESSVAGAEPPDRIPT